MSWFCPCKKNHKVGDIFIDLKEGSVSFLERYPQRWGVEQVGDQTRPFLFHITNCFQYQAHESNWHYGVERIWFVRQVDPRLGNNSLEHIVWVTNKSKGTLGTCLLLVLQASPFPFRSADRFQYARREGSGDSDLGLFLPSLRTPHTTKSDWCCGMERVWFARLVCCRKAHTML